MVTERLQAAAPANLTPSYAVVDLDGLDPNAQAMITKARGLPIRLATKSIRRRAINNRVPDQSGYQGALAHSLAEAIWLARSGIQDILLAYATVDRDAVVDLTQDDQLRESIIVSRDRQLTEPAVGSGLYAPTLFDHYRGFTPTPTAYLVSPVVRKPNPRHAVVYSGGYVPPGPPGWSREPLPWVPRQLRLLRTEGAGEVQTPLRGEAAAALRVGDQVWFRPAKAGELCERFDRLHLVQGDRIIDEVPTYRGEGRNFA